MHFRLFPWPRMRPELVRLGRQPLLLSFIVVISPESANATEHMEVEVSIFKIKAIILLFHFLFPDNLNFPF